MLKVTNVVHSYSLARVLAKEYHSGILKKYTSCREGGAWEGGSNLNVLHNAGVPKTPSNSQALGPSKHFKTLTH